MSPVVSHPGTPRTPPHSEPTPAAAPARKHAAGPRLHPPGPIPGYLLIADRGNNRMLLVDSSHHVFWRYPGGGAQAMPFVFDDDTFFGPDRREVISNQEDQNTIQIISFPGKRVLWRYGHVGVKSGAPGYLNTPDDAYLLPNRLISVADAYNCRVLFLSLAHRIVRQYGTTGVCRHDPPRFLGAVNGATPLPDGSSRWAVHAPVSYPSDPQLLVPKAGPWGRCRRSRIPGSRLRVKAGCSWRSGAWNGAQQSVARLITIRHLALLTRFGHFTARDFCRDNKKQVSRRRLLLSRGAEI